MLDVYKLLQLAATYLSTAELDTVKEKAKADEEAGGGSWMFLYPSLILTALQEKGVDCSDCLLPDIPANA